MQGRRKEDHTKNVWNRLFENEKVHQPIQRDIPEITSIFKEHNVDRVLDLACGSGRHVVHLAREGFEVYGIDISDKGISKAKSLLEEEGLGANLVIGSIYEQLPYKDDFFDAVVCIRALHHGTIDEIREAIDEIERVLKPRGLVYASVRKRISKEMRLLHKYIAPRTYIPLEGKERGLTHYLFNKELFRREFKNFKIHELRIDYGPREWEAYYVLLGELKKKPVFSCGIP